jgi:hypothetical protein
MESSTKTFLNNQAFCLSFLRHGRKLGICQKKRERNPSRPPTTIRRPRARVSLDRLLSSRAGLRFAWYPLLSEGKEKPVEENEKRVHFPKPEAS